MTKTIENFSRWNHFTQLFSLGIISEKKHEVSFNIWLTFTFSITSANVFFLLEQLIDMADNQSNFAAFILAKRYKDFDFGPFYG